VGVACDLGYPCAKFRLPIGLLVFELEPMYATSDRQTTDADHRLIPPRRGHNNVVLDQVISTTTLHYTVAQKI